MISPSRFRSASLLVLGLLLAACSGGGQAEAGAELVAEQTPATSSVPDERSLHVGDSDDVSPPSTSIVPESAPSDSDAADALPLSELAAQVVELPAAFPERVFDGLGDPIGRPPASLTLPALGKSADVIPVGLEANGELEVPGASEIGWYQFGAGVGGGQGSTVLAAHIAYNGRNGVFSNLSESNVGDEIVVGFDGSELAYRVVSVEQYNKLELPIDDLFSESSQERVVLITCGGSFNPNLQSYDDNVVVIAVPS